MIHFSEMEIGSVYRWIENHANWPIQNIDRTDRDGYFIRLGQVYPNYEFMLLEKRKFDYRYAIRGMFIGEDVVGWIVCGNALYPALKIL